MPLANEVKEGQVVHLDGQSYRVVEVDAHFGGGRMGGVVKMRLENIQTGTHTDRRFRPDEKIIAAELERRSLSYLYRDGDVLYFMEQSTCEQFPVAATLLGTYLGYLKDGEQLGVEFLGADAVRVMTPKMVELKVASTAPAQHARETSVWKDAILENGARVQVPLFIAPGDKITIDVETGKYHDRVK